MEWNEFAAATGSTLGMFMLFLAASHDDLSAIEVQNIKQAYFPYICGVHILLDYLIDQEEDEHGGDLNFCSYYESKSETVERLNYMVQHAIQATKRLQHGKFHRMIIQGLLALYLSDPKVEKQDHVLDVRKKLMENSPLSRIFFWINSNFIRKKHRITYQEE